MEAGDICSFIDFMYSSWSDSLSSLDRAMNFLCSDGVVREMSLVENRQRGPSCRGRPDGRVAE